MAVERGETIIVGVNKFSDGKEPPLIPVPDYSALAREQSERLAQVRRTRDAARVQAALDVLREASRGYAADGAPRPPLMERMVDAVRVRASVGEIADVLRETWGEYRPG